MADNNDKVVLNVPGQENVDPSDVTQSSPAFTDPLTGRDTDTGSLNKLNDTRTRKTIKLKPTNLSPGSMPIGAEAPMPVSTESTPISDVISGRDTETAGLDRLNDTRTRKTVKLAPLSPPGAPKITMGIGGVTAPSAPAAPVASHTPAATMILTPVAPATPVAAPDAVPMMTNTDTGSLKTLNDTNTRKTVKLSPAPLTPTPVVNVETPAQVPVQAEEPAVTGTDTGSLQRLNDTNTRKTVKLSPVPLTPTPVVNVETPAQVPVQAVEPAVTGTDTGSLQRLNDNNTRKTVKLSPVPLTPTPAVNVETPAQVPVQAVEPATGTDTGSLQRLDDTTTRKSIKLSPSPVAPSTAETIVLTPPPLPPPAPTPAQLKPISQPLKPLMPTAPVPMAPTAADAAPMPETQDDDTIKLQRKSATNGPSASTQSHADILSPAAAAKNVPGSKQTIKLRPSSGGTNAPDEVKKPTEPPRTPELSKPTAKDTIKLVATPSAAPSAPSLTPSAPTVNLGTNAPTPTPAPALTPSAPTLNLKVPMPPPAATLSLKPQAPQPPPAVPAVAPSAPTVNLSASTPPPPVPEADAPAAEPVAAPAPVAAPSKLGLLFKKKDSAPPPPPVTPVAEELEDSVDEVAAGAEAEAEAVAEEPKKSGKLKLGQKVGGDSVAAGPPMALKEPDRNVKSSPAVQGMSPLCTVVAAITLLCLIATTYITVAQYVNIWQQEKVRTKISVPFLGK